MKDVVRVRIGICRVKIIFGVDRRGAMKGNVNKRYFYLAG